MELPFSMGGFENGDACSSHGYDCLTSWNCFTRTSSGRNSHNGIRHWNCRWSHLSPALRPDMLHLQNTAASAALGSRSSPQFVDSTWLGTCTMIYIPTKTATHQNRLPSRHPNSTSTIWSIAAIPPSTATFSAQHYTAPQPTPVIMAARTASSQTPNTQPVSISPTSSITATTSASSKTSDIHPHYRPAAYHHPSHTTTSSDTPSTLTHQDSDEQHWDNVRLNSHLSVDAWKSQSKVAQKAARLNSSRPSSSDDGDDEGDTAAERSPRRGRERRRSSQGKADDAVAARQQGEPKRPAGWKVRGLSWAVGVSGV